MDSRTITEQLMHLGRIVSGDGLVEGLTPGQWAILRYFAHANRFSQTPSAFAAFHGITRGSASQAIKSMVTQGYLHQARSKADGRSVRLGLTIRPEPWWSTIQSKSWSRRWRLYLQASGEAFPVFYSACWGASPLRRVSRILAFAKAVRISLTAAAVRKVGPSIYARSSRNRSWKKIWAGSASISLRKSLRPKLGSACDDPSLHGSCKYC